jgi:HAD superfamily hydrolase (TIGR01509 family)
MKKSLILFDNDGVLVDTEKWYYEANRIIQAELGHKLDPARYQKRMQDGKSAWNWLQEQGLSEEEIAAGKQRRNALYQEFILTKEISIPGVEETLKRLRPHFKMAIVTTARRVDFDLIHNNRPFTAYMDAIFTPVDYARVKPFPDPYLKALEFFNEKSENTVVVEDTERGLMSAIAANIDCFIVDSEFTRGQDFSKAYKILDSIQQLPDSVSPLNQG